jgi:hypothetical protein
MRHRTKLRYAGAVAAAGVIAAVVAVATANGTSSSVNEGLGRLRLGQTPQHVLAVMGGMPARRDPSHGKPRRFVFTGPKRGGETVVRFGTTGRVAQITTLDPGLKTVIGHVGIGASKARVERVFPGGMWFPRLPIYAQRRTASNGDVISNLFLVTRAGSVGTVSVTDETKLPVGS